MEKYPAIDEKDEEFIKQGIHKAETGTLVEDADSSHDEEEDASDSKLPVDDSNFKPTRILYILRHNLFLKEVNIIDVTSEILPLYAGGDVTDAVRDAARALSEDKSKADTPVYHLERKHWYNSTFTFTSSASPNVELANWKHPSISFGKALLAFPATSSPLSTHPITMAPAKWYLRTNEWVQDSVTYSWKCNSKWKANRMILVKKVGDKQIVVGRYAQRWGSWVTGGVLIVDGREIREELAVLTTCVMLKRMQQRAAERTKFNGGGGGGGGGS
jgi:hypothetical protein